MDLKMMGPKPYAYAGLAAPVIMILCVLFCVIFEDGWDYKVNSMCDFGVSSNPAVAIAFVGGCFVSGILFMIAGLGWVLFEESKYVRIGGAVVIVSGVALICVGIFDKTYDFHPYVSIVYAIIFIVGIAFVCLQDIIDRHLILVGGFTILALYGAATLFSDFAPYALTQTLLMGYVFVWFFLKNLKCFDPKNPTLRKVIGLD